MDPSNLKAILLLEIFPDLWNAELVQEILNEEVAERRNIAPTSVESMTPDGSRASGGGKNDSEEDSEDDFKVYFLI